MVGLAMTRSTDNAAQRALKITELLFRYVLEGLPNKAIAKNLGYSEANVCRDLSLLAEAGWVIKLDNGNYGISTKPVALVQCYTLYMSEYNARSNDFQNRVLAQARQMIP